LKEDTMDMTQKSLERGAGEPRQSVPLVPAVDIWEDADGITLQADMPGVAKDDLDIGVEGDTLTIEGALKLGEPARLQDVHAEVRVAKYKRSFVLGRDLDTGRIDASLRNGVLRLRIPKLETAKPRRIAVKAA
jgi:HSP20 family molecular chaperone IbpA